MHYVCAGTSEQLRGLLANKHLRELLREIDGSADPQAALERAMHIPVFREFADECIRTTGTPNEQ